MTTGYIEDSTTPTPQQVDRDLAIFNGWTPPAADMKCDGQHMWEHRTGGIVFVHVGNYDTKTGAYPVTELETISADEFDYRYGWKSPDGNFSVNKRGHYLNAPDGFSPSTSRDDLAEVLAKLTDEQWPNVTAELATICDPKIARIRMALTATPAQVALAVWRAVCQ